MPDKPVVLMPEDVQRLLGKDAQRNNILAAKMVAEIVKTTLGPKGMDKMLVSPTDEIIVTNDGVTILEVKQIEHPGKIDLNDIKIEKVKGDGINDTELISGVVIDK